MKSWTIFKSHIIPLAKMRLFLRPVMRSLIVPQYALECLKMPSGTIRENRTRWTQFAYFQSVNYSIFFLVKLVAEDELLVGYQGVRRLHDGLAPDLA